MAETTPDKPGFLSRLFGRKAETRPRRGQPAARPPKAGGEPEAMPSPPATRRGRSRRRRRRPSRPPRPTRRRRTRLPAELAGADLQPVEGLEPEGAAPQEPIPQIVTETGPAPRPDVAPIPEAPAVGQPIVPAPAEVAIPAPLSTPAPARGWWQRLTDGMRRTSSSLSDSVTGLFTKRKLDDATLQDLEDVLIQADLGMRDRHAHHRGAVARAATTRRSSPRRGAGDPGRARSRRCWRPVAQAARARPRAKAASSSSWSASTAPARPRRSASSRQKFRPQGLKVMLAAGDTFRAAAIEQLKIWGERTGAPVVAREQGADAAGLAFDALEEAKARRHRRAAHRHGRPAAEQGRADGRARKDRARDQEARPGRAACRAARARCHGRARTPSTRSRCSASRPASTGSS